MGYICLKKPFLPEMKEFGWNSTQLNSKSSWTELKNARIIRIFEYLNSSLILTSGHPRHLMETSEICQAFSSLLSLLFFGESCRDVVPIKGKMCADCGAVVILLEYPTTRGMTDINLTLKRFVNSSVRLIIGACWKYAILAPAQIISVCQISWYLTFRSIIIWRYSLFVC